MRKVFVDTNVVLDFVMEREGASVAQRLLEMGERAEVDLGYSFLSVANTAYVVGHAQTKEDVNKVIAELCRVLRVLSMDERQLKAALAWPTIDFEDNLQYQCAKAHGYDVIVTNNIRHFPFADIEIMTPRQFIRDL